MEFDKSRIYSAVNADELRPGDKVIVAQHLGNLKYQVSQTDYYVWTIKEIKEDICSDRFVTGNGAFPLAYLIERAENCTNCGEGKWDAQHQKILCDPVHCGNGNVIFRNHEIEICEYWKPQTKQKAEKHTDCNHCEEARKVCAMTNACPEKHYRPFKDIEELLDHWYDKTGMRHPDGLIYGVSSLTMPRIWVQRKESPKFKLLITEYDMCFQHLAVGNVWKDLEGLFNNYIFLDGSPCGVEE